MVLIPIIGANLLDMKDMGAGTGDGLPLSVLIAGFIGAFITGWLACRWMIRIVQRGKLYWFALYCLTIGALAMIFGG